MTSQQTAHKIGSKWRSDDIKLQENVDFSGLLLSEVVLQGLTTAGFITPSPIQLQAIPLGRCGLDLIVQAKSGTGKTCVFAVIALESIILESNATQVLVLAPTREIAAQICEVVRSIGSSLPSLHCHMFIGGLPISGDKIKLKKCHIAVGTPGRIKQLIEEGFLKTQSIRLYVLDEADKLLEDSFQENINWIYSSLPINKQMIALSATYPEKLAVLLTHYMRNPAFTRLSSERPALLGIIQYWKSTTFHPLQHIAYQHKVDVLWNILGSVTFSQCLIFSNYQTRAESLCDAITKKGYPAAYISGSHDQTERLKTIERMKNFKCRVLISTDLTARGIDVENVNLIINIDVPWDAQTYLHRIGRAGRYGSKGVAITLASTGEESKKLLKFYKQCHLELHTLPDPLPEDLWTYIPVSCNVSDYITVDFANDINPEQSQCETVLQNSKQSCVKNNVLTESLIGVGEKETGENIPYVSSNAINAKQDDKIINEGNDKCDLKDVAVGYSCNDEMKSSDDFAEERAQLTTFSNEKSYKELMNGNIEVKDQSGTKQLSNSESMESVSSACMQECVLNGQEICGSENGSDMKDKTVAASENINVKAVLFPHQESSSGNESVSELSLEKGELSKDFLAEKNEVTSATVYSLNDNKLPDNQTKIVTGHSDKYEDNQDKFLTSGLSNDFQLALPKLYEDFKINQCFTSKNTKLNYITYEEAAKDLNSFSCDSSLTQNLTDSNEKTENYTTHDLEILLKYLHDNFNNFQLLESQCVVAHQQQKTSDDNVSVMKVAVREDHGDDSFLSTVQLSEACEETKDIITFAKYLSDSDGSNYDKVANSVKVSENVGAQGTGDTLCYQGDTKEEFIAISNSGQTEQMCEASSQHQVKSDKIIPDNSRTDSTSDNSYKDVPEKDEIQYRSNEVSHRATKNQVKDTAENTRMKRKPFFSNNGYYNLAMVDRGGEFMDDIKYLIKETPSQHSNPEASTSDENKLSSLSGNFSIKDKPPNLHKQSSNSSDKISSVASDSDVHGAFTKESKKTAKSSNYLHQASEKSQHKKSSVKQASLKKDFKKLTKHKQSSTHMLVENTDSKSSDTHDSQNRSERLHRCKQRACHCPSNDSEKHGNYSNLKSFQQEISHSPLKIDNESVSAPSYQIPPYMYNYWYSGSYKDYYSGYLHNMQHQCICNGNPYYNYYQMLWDQFTKTQKAFLQYRTYISEMYKFKYLCCKLSK